MSESHIVLLGPPGAGKGTQAVLIAERLGVPHISTGDIFRRNVTEGTALGLQVKDILDAGSLVPDSLTVALIRDRLGQPDAAEGFVLDGFPRTVAQAQELDMIVLDAGHKIDMVLELVVAMDAVAGRLLNRATVEGRADDTEDVIRRRLEVYSESTAPLTGFYAERGLLVRVDGEGAVAEVTSRALDAVRGPSA